MKNFSVLILTFNEDKNIVDCIKSVDSSNDIVILDSLSDDKTKEYANLPNVRFYERKFVNYSDQRNFGLHNISYKNDYVLILDADERVSEKLLQELISLCNTSDTRLHNVYLVRRRVVLENKILKWNLTSTIWIERFVRPTQVCYFGKVHEKLKYKGNHGFLLEYIIHLQFSKGIKHWIERRKRYAQLEQSGRNDSVKTELFSTTVINRRMKLKRFFVNNVPYYYLIYFVYNLFVKFSFFDGYRGLKYITLESYSLYLLSKYRKNVQESIPDKISAGPD